ncbi:MAG: hypothetical protein M1825_000828 [Sarcosagium campestre]|nr:MAG: hypothetical protein M1825_000828 [Sarcosagium campestre]
MKFGQTLLQRSIPEWGSYNIDYNEIKQLIKEHTTSTDPSRAIHIPGSADHCENSAGVLDRELFQALQEQYERIDLFVAAKYGEIERRLGHLHKEVLKLGQHTLAREQERRSARHLERYSRMEEDVLKAGEEIQALSRFVGAQRLGFHKLFKKYLKWTGSSSLYKRFEKSVLRQPQGFIMRGFDPLFTQWSRVLAAVRVPFENDSRGPQVSTTVLRATVPASVGDPSGSTQDQDSSAALLHSASDLSDVAFDTVLASTPIGPKGGRAVYWVHHDNLIELKVLLLHHTRLRLHSGHSSAEGNDEMFVILLDQLDRLISRQGMGFGGDVEVSAQRIPEKAAASVRWSTCGDAAVTVRIVPDNPALGNNVASNTKTLTLNRKDLRKFFESDYPVAREDTARQDSGDEQEIPIHRAVREWFKSRPEVKPLVQISSLRTRFAGLANSPSQGVWVSLDTATTITKARKDWYRRRNRSPTTEFEDAALHGTESAFEEPEIFPHAVLDLRWEGENMMALVRLLDGNHLAERVPGFSVQSHAVALIYEGHEIRPPPWLPRLGRDIRKVPRHQKRLPRRQSSLKPSLEPSVSESPSTRTTSIADGHASSGIAQLIGSSATSAADMRDTNPLNPSRKKKKQRRKRGPKSPRRETPYVKYWNEYDNGDGVAENEPYTLLMDPNADTSIPGQTLLLGWIDGFRRGLAASSGKLLSWISPQEPEEIQQPLNRQAFTSSPCLGAGYMGDTSSLDVYPQSREYATFGSQSERPRHLSRDRLLFLAALGSFISSGLLLVIAALLAVDGRRRLRLSVEVGVILGVVASLGFAAAGAGLTLARKVRLSFLQRGSILLFLSVVCIASGFLLAFAANFR